MEELTIGQQKAMQERQKYLGDPLKTPSYFQPGTLESLSKETQSTETGERIFQIYKPVAESISSQIKSFNELRENNLIDSLKTDDLARVEAYEESRNLYNSAQKKCSEAEDKLLEIQKSLKKSIADKLSEAADRSSQPEAIQQHVKEMKDKSERMQFLRQRIKAGDLETVSVILARQPYLSGLDESDIQHLKEQAGKHLFVEESAGISLAEKLQKDVGSAFLSLQEKLEKYETPEIQRAIRFRDRRN